MTEPYYTDPTVTIHAGDCLDVLATLPDASVDAVVTDPPYGLEFMGKEWDAFKPSGARIRQQSPRDQEPGAAHNSSTFLASRNMPEAFVAGHPFQQWCQLWATECLRVLKPGGHLLAFGGTRTSHRLACAIEDAGFEIRDSIAWLYGSGFPKSLDVSKAIDKAAGAEREVVGRKGGRDAYGHRPDGSAQGFSGALRWGDTHYAWDDLPPEGQAYYIAGAERRGDITAPATPDAERWQGWGTALKPAHEPIVVARKPLAGTVAGNVLAHGTGALNVDGCRVGYTSDADRDATRVPNKTFDGSNNNRHGAIRGGGTFEPAAGRWPGNVILDESQAAALDQQSGESVSPPVGSVTRTKAHKSDSHSGPTADRVIMNGHGDTGGASRFFYTAKAASTERVRVPKVGAGNGRVTGLGGKVRQCNVCETRAIESGAGEPSCGHGDYRWEAPTAEKADMVAHPTVKPLSLMRWLVRLVTPPISPTCSECTGSIASCDAANIKCCPDCTHGRPGLVLEPFAGSGTTVEACILEGFRCIAIEREADYLPLIRQRIHRRRDPVAAVRATGEDGGLFDLLGELP